jgi:holo-[acyl-carrier protein] synthase
MQRVVLANKHVQRQSFFLTHKRVVLIFGIGNDIIEVKRIEQSIGKNIRLLHKLFTENERKYCDGKKNNNVRFQCYAARFAAKEAFFKALGTGYRYGMEFTEIEVFNNKLGKPCIYTSGKVLEFVTKNKISKIHLSISHVKDTATAFVVLEK